MKLLFISGDTALAQGKKGPFYYMLEEFSKYWDRIDIICPKTEQKIFNVHKNVYIHSSDKSIIFQSFFILKKGLEIYKKEKFNIFGVHNYAPFYNDLGGLWLHKRIGIPYFLEIHHITGYPKAGNLKEKIYRIASKFFIRYFAKYAKAIRVVNWTQVPRFLKKHGVSEKKIKAVPSFYIDLETFEPVPESKKYDVVFCGRLAKNKGIFLLLEAVKCIKSQITNPKLQTNSKFQIQNFKIKLIIIGSGPLKNKIKKFVQKNNLEENVVFSGWLQELKDVAKIYNQSKIFVMPSYNEGGPRVTLEAMACGLPIITSRVGVMVDLIKDEENGLFIDWDAGDIKEKILRLMQDKELRNKVAENGYNTARQFERKKMIKNYAVSYQKLISN